MVDGIWYPEVNSIAASIPLNSPWPDFEAPFKQVKQPALDPEDPGFFKHSGIGPGYGLLLRMPPQLLLGCC